MSNWRRYAVAVLIGLALVALAIRFAPYTLRFFDSDEMLFLHWSYAASRGTSLYGATDCFYPPALFALGASVFRLIPGLTAGVVICRVLILLTGLTGFALLFLACLRQRVPWLIVPLVGFGWTLTQFAWKLPEFRGDNLLCPLLLFQCTLLSGTSPMRNWQRLAVPVLGVAAFHVNQKAVFVAIPLLLAFGLLEAQAILNFTRRWGLRLLVGAALLAATAAAWPGYRRFLSAAYIEPMKWVNADADLYPGGGEFLQDCMGRNIAFWVMAAVALPFLLLALRRRTRSALPALAFLLGAVALLNAASFTWLQYQMYLVWAMLWALPVAVAEARDRVRSELVVAMVVIVAAGHTVFHPSRSTDTSRPPLLSAAAEANRVHQLTRPERIAFVSGTVIPATPVLPQDVVGGYLYTHDYADGSWSFRSLLTVEGIPFVHNHQDWLRRVASVADRIYISGAYAPTLEPSLLIASAWHHLRPGNGEFSVATTDSYRTWLLTSLPCRIDGLEAGSGAVIKLPAGSHRVEPAVEGFLLTEHAAPRVSSQIFEDLTEARHARFQSVDVTFGKSFRLRGLLMLDRGNTMVYQLFWEKAAPFGQSLWAFHHFRGSDGSFLHSENVDPGAGWWRTGDIGEGTIFTYRFFIDASLRAARMDIGLFYPNDIARRLPTGSGTVFSVTLPPW